MVKRKTVIEELYGQARIEPVDAQNRVKTITKLESGALRVEQHSGVVFEVAPEDELFQSFIVWMILNPDAK